MQLTRKSILSTVFGAAFVLLLGLGAFAAVRAVGRILVGADKQLGVALITAASTIIVATLTVALGRYYERKKDIDAQFRTEKIKIYDEFLRELFKVLHGTPSDSDEKLVRFLQEWQRKLILWGGNDVLRAYIQWMSRLRLGNLDGQALFLMDDFFRSLRSDIGHTSWGLERGQFIRLIMKQGQFILNEARKNPSITLDELSQLEKQLPSSDSIGQK